MVRTYNHGGQTLTKSFRVMTNDPQASMTQLSVTGKIEALIGIDPKRVRIVGYQGDDFTQKVKITPQNGHGFAIKEVRANRGVKGITWNLNPLSKEPSPKGYELTVSCKNDEEGRYSDLLMLETDLKEKPVLRIPVSCHVYKKPDKDAKTHEVLKPKAEKHKSDE